MQSTRTYKQYSAIADLHNLEFTLTHALGFSAFTSHILVTELKRLTVTIYSNHTLILHGLTFNSSTTNFPWLSSTDNLILILLYFVVRHCIPILLTLSILKTGSLVESRHGQRSTENTCYVSDCVSMGPLPSTGHGADHIENTSSVVPYNHSARTKAGNTCSLLLCDVTAYARMCFSVRCIATVCALTTENTAPVLLAACVLRALPSSGSIRHNINI
jgi:hypothetical protein